MPIAAAAVPYALPVLSGVLTGIKGLFDADEVKKNAYERAGIMESNAGEFDRAAADAIYQGFWESNQVSAGASLAGSAFRTGLAGGGLVIDSGAPLDTLERTDLLGDLDAKMVIRNARNAARGLKHQGDTLRKEAAYTRRTGDDAFKAATWGAGSSIISGGISSIDKYSRLG